MKTSEPWSRLEILLLAKHNKDSWEKMQEALPNRSLEAIKGKLFFLRRNGIEKEIKRSMRTEQENRFKPKEPEEPIENILKRNKEIMQKLELLHYGKNEIYKEDL